MFGFRKYLVGFLWGNRQDTGCLLGVYLELVLRIICLFFFCICLILLGFMMDLCLVLDRVRVGLGRGLSRIPKYPTSVLTMPLFRSRHIGDIQTISFIVRSASQLICLHRYFFWVDWMFPVRWCLYIQLWTFSVNKLKKSKLINELIWIHTWTKKVN